MVIPPILNNSLQTYEDCPICKLYCSEPNQKPLFININFGIIAMKYLPIAGGRSSFYTVDME